MSHVAQLINNLPSPRDDAASPVGGHLVYSFPPTSVARLVCELA